MLHTTYASKHRQLHKLDTNSDYVSDTRIFSDIRFTCHGIITNWIIGGPPQVMPVIKIRHSNNLTTTAATLNTSASNAVSITFLLYNFTMSNEITVQPGDILMIESNATNYMFYQQLNNGWSLDQRLQLCHYPDIGTVVSANIWIMAQFKVQDNGTVQSSNYYYIILNNQ